jgi:uncharacterized membrane protein YczE
VVVVATGWLLGGTFGLGTLLYAVSIGPLVQTFLPAATHAFAECSGEEFRQQGSA